MPPTTKNYSNSIAPMAPNSTEKRLRDLIFNNDGKILIALGVYDGFSVRIALDVGFDCSYMTGAGTCASKLGQADLGFATLNDVREHAEMIANLKPEIPLVADADTGYGGLNMVARTVAAYHRSCVSAIHIENQIKTKRCGHLRGKEIVDDNIFCSRIRAASQAQGRLGSDIVLIARTNALQHGTAPSITSQEAQELGFRIIIFPFATIAPASA
ncbi:Phosphoenolpyruvate/pyruvate domain-containing protein [Lindgomyces ingoldianus]|uniref:Phosphoenolpyruvate/pyruvate domain-containing protein n=1 Tax=Lindgomyces ingoldianus TaxID=673940 RepID=A0ACB6QJH7_9PLEO|nr:Phosphoenolpyruvate/pyruvate domain-containing protein [Lindgomyces ingoldianus]KAF2466296.1 Phosphoenolpyruvate/pyruvate domain-containing protein [Lindgomyces ingoldianus]